MAANLHATAVVLGDRGVMITGASGTGKTGLALALLSHAQGNGLFSRLVADDQLLLSAHDGRLVCSAPAAIAGLVEMRGVGPRLIAFQSQAVVDLVVELVDQGRAPRFPDRETKVVEGCEIGSLVLLRNDISASVFAVASWLAQPYII